MRKDKQYMTAAEAGRKGGNTTKARYGPGYYEAIGKKGGAEVKRIIAAGKKALSECKDDNK